MVQVSTSERWIVPSGVIFFAMRKRAILRQASEVVLLRALYSDSSTVNRVKKLLNERIVVTTRRIVEIITTDSSAIKPECSFFTVRM